MTAGLPTLLQILQVGGEAVLLLGYLHGLNNPTSLRADRLLCSRLRARRMQSPLLAIHPTLIRNLQHINYVHLGHDLNWNKALFDISERFRDA